MEIQAIITGQFLIGRGVVIDIYDERNITPYVIVCSAPPWGALLRETRTEPNKLEVGFREGDKIPKGEHKMRKAKRGW